MKHSCMRTLWQNETTLSIRHLLRSLCSGVYTYCIFNNTFQLSRVGLSCAWTSDIFQVIWQENLQRKPIPTPAGKTPRLAVRTGKHCQHYFHDNSLCMSLESNSSLMLKSPLWLACCLRQLCPKSYCHALWSAFWLHDEEQIIFIFRRWEFITHLCRESSFSIQTTDELTWGTTFMDKKVWRAHIFGCLVLCILVKTWCHAFFLNPHFFVSVPYNDIWWEVG